MKDRYCPRVSSSFLFALNYYITGNSCNGNTKRLWLTVKTTAVIKRWHPGNYVDCCRRHVKYRQLRVFIKSFECLRFKHKYSKHGVKNDCKKKLRLSKEFDVFHQSIVMDEFCTETFYSALIYDWLTTYKYMSWLWSINRSLQYCCKLKQHFKFYVLFHLRTVLRILYYN